MPPISRITRFACRPAFSAMFFPTTVDPVKVTSRVRGCSTKVSPTSPPRSDDDVDDALRESRSLRMPRQAQRRQRSGARRLDDDRVARGECGGHLVGEQVEREVERANRDHDPDRVPNREKEPSLITGRIHVRIGGKRLPRQVTSFVGRELVHGDGPSGLDARVDDRLAHLLGDESGHFRLVRGQSVRQGS